MSEHITGIEVDNFKNMIERAVKDFPNFQVVATTLRDVHSATINDWGAVCWHAGEFHEATHRPKLEIYDRVGGAITFIQDQVSYLFDNSATQLFGDTDPSVALANDPRFTSVTNLQISNTAPTITRPFTPFVNGGVPTGNATGEFNFAVDQNFVTPYSFTYSLGIQRELPGNLLLDLGYVGRQGRRLFTQADAAQILDFKDPASGQSMLDAFNALQAHSGGPGAGRPRPARAGPGGACS